MSEPDTLMLGQNGWVPNNPALPVLIYRGVVPVSDPDAIEATLRRNDWRPDWRDGVYPYHHYHSTAHEALACTDGTSRRSSIESLAPLTRGGLPSLSSARKLAGRGSTRATP